MTSARPRLMPAIRSISHSLHLATASAVLAVAALLTLIYTVESGRLEDARVTTLRSMVESAAGVATAYDKAEQAGQMTRQEAQQAAMTAISAMRYSGAEYIYILDRQNRMVMTPANPELIGKDVSSLKDTTGKLFILAIANLVHARGSGVVDYSRPQVG
ncbi:cache domain-containing protein [Rhodopila globiformis]|nr:cache domain-containing protein [Rhodopila globiformis]